MLQPIRLLPVLVALSWCAATAQLRADLTRATPSGPATLKVFGGPDLLFQATTPGLGAVTTSKFSADGRWLLNIADGQGYVQLWNVAAGQWVRTFLAPFPRIVNADFTPDSRHLRLNFRGEPGTLDAEPAFWTLDPLRPVAQLSDARSDGENYARESGYDRSVSFSADGQRMVFARSGSYGKTGAVSVWDARSGTRLATLSRLPYPAGALQTGGVGIDDARLSPDGRRVLVLSIDGRLAEYDVDTARLLNVRGRFTSEQVAAQLGIFARTGR